MPQKIGTFRVGALSRSDVIRSYEGSESRAEDKRFYASTAWRRLRAAFLRAFPLCADCLKANRLTEAEHVHHIKERKDRPDLALDWDNLESACPSCHNSKRRRS